MESDVLVQLKKDLQETGADIDESLMRTVKSLRAHRKRHSGHHLSRIFDVSEQMVLYVAGTGPFNLAEKSRVVSFCTALMVLADHGKLSTVKPESLSDEGILRAYAKKFETRPGFSMSIMLTWYIQKLGSKLTHDIMRDFRTLDDFCSMAFKAYPRTQNESRKVLYAPNRYLSKGNKHVAMVPLVKGFDVEVAKATDAARRLVDTLMVKGRAEVLFDRSCKLKFCFITNAMGFAVKCGRFTLALGK